MTMNSLNAYYCFDDKDCTAYWMEFQAKNESVVTTTVFNQSGQLLNDGHEILNNLWRL